MSALKRPLPRLASVKTLEKYARDGFAHREWYQLEAIKLAGRAKDIGCEFTRYIDVLAITSPKVHVSKNGKLTEAYIRHGSVDGVMKGVRAGLAHYEQTGEIRGPKTSKFAAALKGDLSAVVLDLWMSRAFGCDQLEFSRVAVHRECTKRVNAVAKSMGIFPAEAQAAIWFGVIIEYGYDVDKKVF